MNKKIIALILAVLAVTMCFIFAACGGTGDDTTTSAADACIIDITMANAMTGEGTSYADLGYSVELETEEYGISFREGSDVTAEVNKIMAEMKADGTLQALAEKYELTLVD